MSLWSTDGSKLSIIENTFITGCLLLMAAFPVLEILSRTFGFMGITGSTDYTRHLTLIIGLIGAIITTRERRHLSLQALIEILPKTAKRMVGPINSGITVAVAVGLALAGYQFVSVEFDSMNLVGQQIPIWIVLLILPVGYMGVALREFLAVKGNQARLITLFAGSVIVISAWLSSPELMEILFYPILIFFMIFGALGLPIFASIGGIALALFLGADIPTAAISVETYRIVASPVLPTIPLFTLAGYLLAEGGASKRLVELFKSLLGWLPAGPAIATIFVCTFFTTFTGASGVTIIAVGGLLLPVLLASGFDKRFSVGLLTASGSLGLLFPPALPIIFYGVISHTPINKLFLAGILPGVLLLVGISGFSWYRSRSIQHQSLPFDRGQAWQSIKAAKWELLIPFISFGGIFGGLMTLVETAAVVVFYLLVIEVFVNKGIRTGKKLLSIFMKSSTLIGAILIILSVSMGLTNYLVDAQIPSRASEWVAANIDNRITFLLFLNLFLLGVGMMMDIFSAIMVVVPIIIPMAAVFNIHPLHLGIIFLANLELGYLTPPVGLNLFLSAIRFDRPLAKVYRDTLPFFFLLLIMVLIITYFPALVLWIPGS